MANNGYIAIILILAFFPNSLWSQNIPNGNFEDWTENNEGIASVDKWETLNEPDMIYIEKAEGHSGEHAACLNVVWDQMIQSFTGAIMRSDEEIYVNTRSSALKGYYLTKAATTDTLYVEIEMYSKGNHIGEGEADFCKSNRDWTSFSVPITYHSKEIPDHAEIVIYINPSKGGLHLSKFCIDDLMFEN